MNFMTNADIPTIAFESTVKNPVNPYTNKKIDNQEKYAPQAVYYQLGLLYG